MKNKTCKLFGDPAFNFSTTMKEHIFYSLLRITGSLDLGKNMKKTSLGIINMGHVLITCIYRRQ